MKIHRRYLVSIVSALAPAPSGLIFSENVTSDFDEGSFILNWTDAVEFAEYNVTIWVNDIFWQVDKNDTYLLAYNFSNTTEANYTFMITGWIANGTQGDNSTNVSMYIDRTGPVMTFPVYTNGTIRKNTELLTLNVSVIDDDSGLTGSMCIIDGNGTNQTFAVSSSGWCNASTIWLTNLADGNRTINVYTNDTVSIMTLNNSYVVQVDTTAPNVSYSCNSAAVSQDGVLTCTCSGTDGTSGFNSSSLSYTVSPSTANTGPHSVTCSANDYAGNSQTATFSYTVEGVNSGTTGSGSSTIIGKTYSINSDLFLQGYSRALGVSDRLIFPVKEQEHSVKVLEITTTTAKIVVSSDPQEAILKIGEPVRFEITGDSIYDMEVTLNSINGNNVNISIKENADEMTSEEIQEKLDKKISTGDGEDISIVEKNLWNKLLWLWIILIIFGAAAIIYFSFMFMKLLKKK